MQFLVITVIKIVNNNYLLDSCVTADNTIQSINIKRLWIIWCRQFLSDADIIALQHVVNDLINDIPPIVPIAMNERLEMR